MTVLAMSLAGLLAIAQAVPPADSLVAAKDLYAAAAYDDALAMLTRMSGAETDRGTGAAVDEYRWLCLFALGRASEADAAVRELLQKEPLFELTEELPPRAAAIFAATRQRLLPAIAKEKYRDARTAIDAGQFASAESELNQVITMIDEAVRSGVKDESIGDLAVLAQGFRDLAHRAATPADASGPPPAAPTAAATAPAHAASAARRPSPAYSASDADVVAPVTVAQVIPPLPAQLARSLQGKRGVVQVTINTEGRVTDVLMREPINRVYDSLVVSAAKLWRYRPATRNGVAVRYIKAIALELNGED